MAGKKEAVVVLCRCGEAQKTFGITAEKMDADSWKFVWAFPIKEKNAKQEGYDKTRIEGKLYNSDEYPGCPYCHRSRIIICDCGRIGCKVREDYYKCPWCGSEYKTFGTYNGEGIIAGEDA
jgi:hypothetical protein